MKSLKIVGIASRIAMPIVKSNVPLDTIPDYAGLLEKVDIPINLYISDQNVVPHVTSRFVDIDKLESEFQELYPPSSTSPVQALRIKNEIESFKQSLEPNSINIITNRSSDRIDSQAGANWLAHDLYHVVEQYFTPESIMEFVEEDVDIYDSNTGNQYPSSTLGLQVHETLFFYWLPKQFKDKAPAFNLNMKQNGLTDLLPDIMLSYLNDPTTPKNIEIEYKPAWQDAAGHLKSRRPSDPKFIIVPKPRAHAVSTMVDLLLEEIYDKIRSMFEKFRGKIVMIG